MKKIALGLIEDQKARHHTFYCKVFSNLFELRQKVLVDQKGLDAIVLATRRSLYQLFQTLRRTSRPPSTKH